MHTVCHTFVTCIRDLEVRINDRSSSGGGRILYVTHGHATWYYLQNMSSETKLYLSRRARRPATGVVRAASREAGPR